MTKPDENGQLTDPQRLAIAELLAGATDEQAAKAAGVTRQTVNTWRNHDPEFAAELNRRRSELWEGHTDRLRTLVGAALGVVTDDLQNGDQEAKRQAAWAVLKLIGKDLMLTPTGLKVADKIALEWQQERTVSQLDRMFAEM